jgi:PTS system nitrogen regulatory IIA component
MNLVAELLPEAHIVTDLEVTSKKRLFEQIGLLLENSRQVPRAKVFDSLFDRERLGSTGLGYGVAIPHGRIKALKETLGVFVRTREGVNFEAPDARPVRLVFAMLAPEHATDRHLQILSELAQMFSDEPLRAALLGAADPAAVLQLIRAWSPYAERQAA